MTLCLPVHGCDTVTGGAVELSWKLRPASSALDTKFVDCEPDPRTEPDRGPVAKISLQWQVEGDQGTSAGWAEWPCDDSHGATRFELEPGTAQLWVAPKCSDDQLAAPGTYIAPATVQREVIRGETVSLGAVEIVVGVSNCANQPCICR